MPGMLQATVKPGNWAWIEARAGQPHEAERVQCAIKQSDELCRVLELEGVKVRRPDVINWVDIGDYRTPDFEEGGKDGLSYMFQTNFIFRQKPKLLLVHRSTHDVST